MHLDLSELSQLAPIFRELFKGYHVSRRDPELYAQLSNFQDQYRTLFKALGFELVCDTRGFYYFVPDLAAAMTMNPGLHVLVQQGWYDLATPYLATRMDLEHLNITPEARKRVPQTFSKADTIHILNRASLVTAAFATGRLESLRGCFDDRIHQPYRAALIPGMDAILAAGVKAGAIGGWLSGSGSTLMCLALDNTEAIAAAMQRKMPKAAVHILKPDNAGVKVSLKNG